MDIGLSPPHTTTSRISGILILLMTVHLEKYFVALHPGKHACLLSLRLISINRSQAQFLNRMYYGALNSTGVSGVLLSLFAFVVLHLPMAGQERVTTLGVQLKPMIPSKFFGTSRESSGNGEFTADFVPTLGLNFGMVVRHGLTKMWSFETGINLVQRNYHIDFTTPSVPFVSRIGFRLVGYEVPVQALVYVKLGEQLWMNASGGFSLDMYPSDVYSTSTWRKDTLVVDFTQNTYRRRWIQMAVLANYGFEWRTKDRGYLYAGASFHRPFQDIALTGALLEINSNPSSLYYPLSGSYLTFDLRYFFHEDPERRRKKGSSR